MSVIAIAKYHLTQQLIGNSALLHYGIAALLQGCDNVRMAFHGYVAVQSRGVVALPAEVRRRLHLDEPGAQVEITERDDGVLELRASLPIPADQRWFWTQRWQQREREVDAHVAAGEIAVHVDGEALLDHLEQLEDDADAAGR